MIFLVSRTEMRFLSIKGFKNIKTYSYIVKPVRPKGRKSKSKFIYLKNKQINSLLI
jgi:hypothetical protein